MRDRHVVRAVPGLIVVVVMLAGAIGLRALQSWIVTGSPAFPRAQSFSLTRLADGRVLVAGGLIGTTGEAATDGVEIYDPASGAWSSAAPLPYPVSRHDALLLDDGRVLLAGGLVTQPDGSGLPTARVWLYDPASDSWLPTGSMNHARLNFALAKLPDGRVLATAGLGAEKPVVEKSAELYDPATGTWTPTEHMQNARFVHRATTLRDGRALVTGGSLAGHCNTKATAEIFDPDTGTWRPTAPMTAGRTTHLSVLLDDGRVLVAGGFSHPVATCNSDGRLESVTETAEIYDPERDRWTSTGSLNVARAGNQVYARLADGRVLYAGGSTPNAGQGTDRTSTAEIYDPDSGGWTLVPSMTAPHTGGSAVRLLDGRVLVVAGGPFAAFRLVELFRP